ncbi:hypothetical protein, partial [Adlercreutzia caecimuris]|jgi:hypothetical protein|uniref:hypothetical protein n=1 Tax=Adlercreutzia caecimuris TaxID=671266 RepID=UPI00256FC65C
MRTPNWTVFWSNYSSAPPNASGKEAVLILSREQTRGFIVNCSRFFDVKDPESPQGTVKLKEGFSVEDLAQAFCGGIAVPVLEALLSRHALEVLRAA